MNYYDEIKETLMQCEVKTVVKDYTKNKMILDSYYYVGKMLSEAGKHYGEGIVKEYSKKLENEVGEKYSVTTLKYMRQFYNFRKSQPAADFLTWSHWIELLPLKDSNKIEYYIKLTETKKLSRNKLREAIKSKEYERLLDDTKGKLENQEEIKPSDLIPNPILIQTKNKDISVNLDNVKESMLKEYILENIDYFLNELGVGYSYVGSEYKLKENGIIHRIDILLFNMELNCYVVIELKVTELKKEHVGQILYYVNYVDKNIKKDFHNKTIGIILCKEDNRLIAKYISDERIHVREFKLI